VEEKASVRAELALFLKASASVNADPKGKLVFLRVNSLEDMAELTADLSELITRETGRLITGFVLPKVSSVDDMNRFEQLVATAEMHAGMTVGTLRFIPTIETAAALFAVNNIAGAISQKPVLERRSTLISHALQAPLIGTSLSSSVTRIY
jgi:citrate lyase beta subunit